MELGEAASRIMDEEVKRIPPQSTDQSQFSAPGGQEQAEPRRGKAPKEYWYLAFALFVILLLFSSLAMRLVLANFTLAKKNLPGRTPSVNYYSPRQGDWQAQAGDQGASLGPIVPAEAPATGTSGEKDLETLPSQGPALATQAGGTSPKALRFIRQAYVSKGAAEGIVTLHGQVYSFDQDRYYVSDDKGILRYTGQGSFMEPILVSYKDYTLMGDRRTGQMVLLQGDTEVFRAKLEGAYAAGTIFEAEGTICLAVLDENRGQGSDVGQELTRAPVATDFSLKLFSLATDRYIDIRFGDFQYPLNVSFQAKTGLVMVLMQDLSGGRLAPYIRLYDLEGNLVSTPYLTDQTDIYTSIVPSSQDGWELISDRSYLRLNAEFQPVYETTFPHNYRLITVGKNNYLLALSATGQKPTLFTWDPAGNELVPLATLPEVFTNYTVYGSYIAGLTDSFFCIYDSSRQKMILQTTLPYRYSDFSFVDAQNILFVRTKELDLYTLTSRLGS